VQIMASVQRRLRKQPRGQALVTMAVALLAILGFAGLAIDVGMVFMAKNEVQNAADAAALAGASKFYENYDPRPNWSAAEALATTAIGYNQSMKQTLVNGTVTSGYWNLSGSPATLQSKTKSPLATNDVPAVRVQISKRPGSNGGSIVLLLAPMVGIQSLGLTATATAVSSFPGKVIPGAVLPVATTKCLYDNYWDSARNEPKLDPLTGQPYEFKLTSSYHTGPCEAGQWTSFLLDQNDVPIIRGLIANGNPQPFGVGDQIWIEPGTKTALYADVPVGEDVLLPIVTDIGTHAKNTVVGFGPFHITASVGGSGKYIQGHFIKNYKEPFASGGGPAYGAIVPPQLVQ
jgi:Flp pilus assembly protein TadG